MRHRQMTKRGFTLIELLVTIAIIGILASIIISSLLTAREKAQIVRAQLELVQVKTAMEVLFDDTGVYPNGATSVCRTTLPGSNEVDLSTADAGITGNTAGFIGWNGPYMPDATDVWGTPYYLDEDYQCFTNTIGCKGITDSGTDSSVIVSCGPNRVVSSGSCTYDEDNIVIRLCD